jgi:alkylhydroperoxidase family enzyme
VTLTNDSSTVRADDLARLRAEGLDDAAIHDAIQVIAYVNYINRVADGVGIEDEPGWEA